MPTAIPFKNISIKITYVIYYYLYLIINIIKQKVWKGITTLQRLRGAIFLDRTRPVLPDRTAFLPSTGRGPPDGPLNIALYRTRPSPRPSPLPSTGPGPLHKSPETRRLALYRTRPYQHNSSKAKTFKGLNVSLHYNS